MAAGRLVASRKAGWRRRPRRSPACRCRPGRAPATRGRSARGCPASCGRSQAARAGIAARSLGWPPVHGTDASSHAGTCGWTRRIMRVLRSGQQAGFQLGPDLGDGTGGIDHADTVRIRLGAIMVGRAGALEEGRALALETVWFARVGGADAPLPAASNSQVRSGWPCIQASSAATRSAPGRDRLVGIAGVGIAVADHPGAARQRSITWRACSQRARSATSRYPGPSGRSAPGRAASRPAACRRAHAWRPLPGPARAGNRRSSRCGCSCLPVDAFQRDETSARGHSSCPCCSGCAGCWAGDCDCGCAACCGDCGCAGSVGWAGRGLRRPRGLRLLPLAQDVARHVAVVLVQVDREFAGAVALGHEEQVLVLFRLHRGQQRQPAAAIGVGGRPGRV